MDYHKTIKGNHNQCDILEHNLFHVYYLPPYCENYRPIIYLPIGQEQQRTINNEPLAYAKIIWINPRKHRCLLKCLQHISISYTVTVEKTD